MTHNTHTHNFVIETYIERCTTHSTLLLTVNMKYRFIIEHFND